MNPFVPGYYNEHDLEAVGFKALGHNVQIAKNCTIIGPEKIAIGDNVRIDGYTTILASRDGWLELGSYIHIGAYCFLGAAGGIRMEDFTTISQGVKIYSGTDDYSGMYLISPIAPREYTGVTLGTVTLHRHVLVGSGTGILPKLSIGEGSSVGAMSFVKKSLEPWGIYAGCPVRRLKARSKNLLKSEAKLREDKSQM